mmetsp:Transcript_97462/g.260118  ORF Transcript_97462/g.260118 Transcript_97462/m.260118 type:complete len:346 (+) Transcript_97462:23-1060(+)
MGRSWVSFTCWAVAFSVVNVASFVGCVWMIMTIRKKPQEIRRRLFPRQLTSLAAADTGLQIAGLSFVWFQMPGDRDPDQLCFVWELWLHVFRYVSVLQQLHIAVILVCQAQRYTTVLNVLGASVFMLVWPFGIILGVADLFLTPWWYERGNTCRPEGPGYMSVSVMLLVAASSVVAYISASIRAFRHSPGSVARQVFRRAAMYPVIFLVSYGLVTVGYLNPRLVGNTWFWNVANLLEFANGLLNVLLYGSQNKYVSVDGETGCSTISGRTSRRQLWGSFQTMFDLDQSSSQEIPSPGFSVLENVGVGLPPRQRRPQNEFGRHLTVPQRHSVGSLRELSPGVLVGR